MKGIYEKLVSIKVLRPFAITLYVIIKRAIPIIVFALLLAITATMIDRHNVRSAAGSNYINYYAFNVTNAREGEDVYFTVCRRHEQNYAYSGNLSVYVYRNADPKETPVQVHSKDIKGNLHNAECENKVLRAADFTHTKGTYKMSFCVNFNVKYNEPKTVCKDSNIYKIYANPTDISSRITFYENQLNTLRAQMQEANSGTTTEQFGDSSMSTNNSQQTVTPNEPQQSEPTSNVPTQNTDTPPATTQRCTNILGVPLFCRTDTNV